jgi:undecaprenyl-diphosphatase
MTNRHLFELLNAGPGADHLHVALALFLAQWAIYVVPLAMTIAWFRAGRSTRRELMRSFAAVMVSLAIAQWVVHVWPQPRPFALHLGTQFMAHGADPGLPSDHVTVLWTLALYALTSRRFGMLGAPLLALGLVVGWSRVYLGVHFPYDILGAFPVALCGVLIVRALRKVLRPVEAAFLDFYDGGADRLRAKWASTRKV